MLHNSSSEGDSLPVGNCSHIFITAQNLISSPIEHQHYPKLKGEILMRKRTFSINVRVTESEKKRLMRTAKRCGLSLSEYLRKVGLNKKLSEKPNEKLYEVYSLISDLRRDFYTMSNATLEVKLNAIEQKLLAVYHSDEDGDSGGDNENLGY